MGRVLTNAGQGWRCDDGGLDLIDRNWCWGAGHCVGRLREEGYGREMEESGDFLLSM
jgi:hypothetical protein